MGYSILDLSFKGLGHNVNYAGGGGSLNEWLTERSGGEGGRRGGTLTLDRF